MTVTINSILPNTSSAYQGLIINNPLNKYDKDTIKYALDTFNQAQKDFGNGLQFHNWVKAVNTKKLLTGYMSLPAARNEIFSISLAVFALAGGMLAYFKNRNTPKNWA